MPQPTYSQLLNPSENVAELIAYQNAIGLSAGEASGAEPFEVLIGKATFNAQQQSPPISVSSVLGTTDEVDVITLSGVATVSLPDVLSFIGKTIVGGTYSSITASGAFTGTLTGNVTGNLTGNATGNVSGTAANVTGIVGVANGGTGQSSFTNGQLMIGNTATGLANKATIAAGNNVTVSNGNGTISIAANQMPSSGSLYSTLKKTISGSVATSADMAWSGPYVYNVVDYGADRTGANDSTAAVQAATDALQLANPAGSGGTLYFPSGSYKITSITAFTSNVYVEGDGQNATTIIVNTAGDAVFTFSNAGGAPPNNGGWSGISKIGFSTPNARNEGSPILKVRYSERFNANNLSGNVSGDLFLIESVNWAFLSDILFRNGYPLQGVMVRTKGAALQMSNVNFSSVNNLPATRSYPCVIFEGYNSTATRISGCTFGGGGPRYVWSGKSIASTPTDFTISFATSADIGINEYLIIENSTIAGYNGKWRIESKTANSATILSTANLGAATADIKTVPCVVIIGNTGTPGANNEAKMDSCIFEAVGYPTDAISTSVFIDGTKSDYTIAGWTFDSCYCDYGNVGMLLVGGGLLGYAQTVRSIMISHMQTPASLRGVSIEQASGVFVDNYSGSGFTNVPGSAGIYIWGRDRGGGIQISNSYLGGFCGWSDLNPGAAPMDYGLWIDGAIDGVIDGLIVTGCNINGGIASVRITPLAPDVFSTATIKTSGNSYFTSATIPPLLSTAIPTVVSAATIDLPWNDVITITGGTNINTINGGWQGREVLLIASGATTITTAGNVLVGKVIASGAACRIVYTGTSWKILA